MKSLSLYVCDAIVVSPWTLTEPFLYVLTDILQSPLSIHDDPPHDQLLTSLEKQLSIETKVKNGAENMIQSITSGRHGRDKKQLLAEAQQMLADAKAKIEFLRLRILKVRQNRQLNKVRFCCRIYLAQPFYAFSRLSDRFLMRMVMVNVVNLKRRWKNGSKSCYIGCESRRQWWPVPKMW